MILGMFDNRLMESEKKEKYWAWWTCSLPIPANHSNNDDEKKVFSYSLKVK